MTLSLDSIIIYTKKEKNNNHFIEKGKEFSSVWEGETAMRIKRGCPELESNVQYVSSADFSNYSTSLKSILTAYFISKPPLFQNF